MGTYKRFAFCLAALIAPAQAAYAGDCAQASPECHLANGTKLLNSDPRRAAVELLASYKLDERTDTLTLYATALQADRQYARALATWERIIVFRESEIETAKETLRAGSRSKRARAKAMADRAQEQSEEAAAQIMKLWEKVARVRIQVAAGQRLLVTHAGVEVDISKVVLVNAGRDELMVMHEDGTVERLVIELAAGQTKVIDAPAEPTAKPPTVVPTPIVIAPEAKDEPAPSVVVTPKREPVRLRLTEEPRSRTASRIGLGVMAGGLVTLGVASTFGYLANRDFDDAKALGCNADGDCPVGAASELGRQANDRSRVAQITAIGGGALLVTGAAMWIIGRTTTKRASSDVSVSITPSSATLGWSFQ